ncbi:hypothetical protein EZV62_013747 [Acer yangbiense]|uniref:Cryptochrome DASH n=1 Tax=Acer yangbiense TaxID=1000413 RepID=A0A5C7I057_9ROSI|nr:hypothetical protein EZV62_013747 [Acer yangbiense]
MGTTIIGVTYDGGVVLGADSRTSTGMYVANRASDKITELTDNVYVCRSGSAADSQIVSDYNMLQTGLIVGVTEYAYALTVCFFSLIGCGNQLLMIRLELLVLEDMKRNKFRGSEQKVLPSYIVFVCIFRFSGKYLSITKSGLPRLFNIILVRWCVKEFVMRRIFDMIIRPQKINDIVRVLLKRVPDHPQYNWKIKDSNAVETGRVVSQCFERYYTSTTVKRNGKGIAIVCPMLQLIWGTTMYHLDDIPFNSSSIPDVYTQFRKASFYSMVTNSVLTDTYGCELPCVRYLDWGCVPSIDQLGLQSQKASLYVSKGMKFVGGESAALGRVYEYLWKKDLLRVYKETRNGMLGPDYSTKFSPWLASGSLSPRYIYEEVKRYERERQANDSTYWVLFELIWRDYFRFISLKYGNALFHLGGPRKVEHKWSQDQKLFESWRDGCTGYPLIDANMKELTATGFMSNRGRQIVCSFLVRDMGIDWRMGAEWFETCLLDYDPCSNYGNWTYGAGVGNDPREDRYFSIPKQAQTYDPEGEYVAYWLPQLQGLPKDKRNFPGSSYIEQVVPLKFGNMNPNRYQNRASTGRRTNFRAKQATQQQ